MSLRACVLAGIPWEAPAGITHPAPQWIHAFPPRHFCKRRVCSSREVLCKIKDVGLQTEWKCLSCSCPHAGLSARSPSRPREPLSSPAMPQVPRRPGLRAPAGSPILVGLNLGSTLSHPHRTLSLPLLQDIPELLLMPPSAH